MELSRLLRHFKEINSDDSHSRKRIENDKNADNKDATRHSKADEEPAKHSEVETEIEKHNGLDVGAEKQRLHVQKELESEKRRTVDQKVAQVEVEAKLIHLLYRLQQSRADQHPGEKVSEYIRVKCKH